jgi:hypothetical protein
VFAAEHLLGFPGFDAFGQFVEGAGEVVANRLPRFDPLGEHAEIVEPLLQGPGELQILFETAAALEEFLRTGLVFPEVRSGNAFLDAGEFF